MLQASLPSREWLALKVKEVLFWVLFLYFYRARPPGLSADMPGTVQEEMKGLDNKIDKSKNFDTATVPMKA